MGKAVGAVVGIVAAVAIAIAAPYLAPLAVSALFGAAAVTATTVAIATAVISTVLAVGVSLAFRAMGIGALGAPTAKGAAGPPQVFRQSVTGSFIVYGRRRVGGLLVFFHSKKVGNDHYRYFVIAVAGHHVRAIAAPTYFLNDEEVILDGPRVTNTKYADNAYLWFQYGNATETANSTFVSECDGKWTSNHIGHGVTAIYARFKLTDKVIEAGMPNITAVIDGKDDIFDPRGGGSVGYRNNAALVFYDWMRMPREEGGFGAYADEIPSDAWLSAQANVCDETVNSNPRYTINGVIATGASPAEVRDAMIVNMAGSYTFSGGQHLMRPGYWVPSSATLSEDDLAGPIQVSPFMGGDVTANEVNGTYIDPSIGYQGAPFTTQLLDPEPDDIRQMDLDLGFTTLKDQADRVARIMLNRAQHEKTVVWPMNIVGLKQRALDTVQLGTMRYGLDNYAWQVSGWGLSSDWGVVLNLREETADIYDDPDPVAPVTPPSPTVPDPIQSIPQITQQIFDSRVTGLTFSIAASGAVTISDHSRVYNDKTVSVDGTGGTPHASGGASGDRVLIFYDQEDRSGGAVTYQHLVLAGGTGDTSPAFASSTNPYRHFVLTGLVPASGSAGGGSAAGSGGGAAGGGGGLTAIP